MNKLLQTTKYIEWDILSAMLAWGVFFLYRKVSIEQVPFSELGLTLHDSNFWMGILLLPPAWVCLYAIQGTYRDVFRKARLTELQQTFWASLIGVIVIFFVLLLDDNIVTYRNYYLSFFVLFLLHFGITYVGRVIITSRTARLVHTRRIGFPTLLVGHGEKALRTYQELDAQAVYSGNIFVGCVAVGGNTAGSLAGIMPCLGGLDDLGRLIDQYKIEEVIFALDDSENTHINEIICMLVRRDDVIVKITPDLRDIVYGSVRISSIFHSPLIIINPPPVEAWQCAVKRLMDIVLSLLALLLLSPLFIITAFIVKFTSPGPVFYAQERIGYRGKPFKMHKFRSMYVDAESSGPALSSDDDPRITPFGRIMRKYRLDEIPQFYNVLKGTMSIVGPRPERQYFIDRIVQRAPEYLLLQKVKPGITSWGQVKYGYAENVDEMLERMRYDLLYLENMSIGTDIKILLYTVLIILQGRGK